MDPPLHDDHGNALHPSEDEPALVPRHRGGGEALDGRILKGLLDVDLVGVIAQAGAEDQGDLRLEAGPGPDALQARLQFPVYFAHM